MMEIGTTKAFLVQLGKIITFKNFYPVTVGEDRILAVNDYNLKEIEVKTL